MTVAHNIEVKARARDFEKQSKIAENLGDGRVEHMVQEDTFFRVGKGRLKLRVFEDGTGELIQYHRDDASGPTLSSYVCSAIRDPRTLREALANALGIRAVVRKNRTVYFIGQTRVHLDQVENLGQFIELEVVLKPDQDEKQGMTIANRLVHDLGIGENDLIDTAYVDLLGGDPNRSSITD